MHVLVTGATGFVGRHVCARLLADGQRITAVVRDPLVATRRFPGITAIQGDLNRMTDPWDWRPLLVGVDAVVNCAGILQARPGAVGRGHPHQRAEHPVRCLRRCRRAPRGADFRRQRGSGGRHCLCHHQGRRGHA